MQIPTWEPDPESDKDALTQATELIGDLNKKLVDTVALMKQATEHIEGQNDQIAHANAVIDVLQEQLEASLRRESRLAKQIAELQKGPKGRG